MRRTALTALVALMVVLAGCGASTQGTPTTATQTDGTTLQPSGGSYDGPSGTLAFYVSDQPAAIEDFEHLNVTITKIGLKKQTDDGEEIETQAASEDGETDPQAETDDDEASTTQVSTTKTEDGDDDTGNASTVTSTVTTTTAGETTTTATETTSTTSTTTATTADESDDDGTVTTEETDEESTEDADWVTYEVDNRTVDLTQLTGPKATRVADLEAPSGNYSTVFVYVTDVEGTLTNGETVNVKLPSQKLQLHETFHLGPDSKTEFVYDIAVHKAGGSGKYILKPNIGESGTDMEIQEVHDDEGADHDAQAAEHHDDDENETVAATAENETDDAKEMPDREPDDSGHGHESKAALNVTLQGNVTAGDSVTLQVTDENGAVAGAAVTVNGEQVGTTDADGELSITVPEDAEELEVEVAKADSDGSVEIEITDG